MGWKIYFSYFDNFDKTLSKCDIYAVIRSDPFAWYLIFCHLFRLHLHQIRQAVSAEKLNVTYPNVIISYNKNLGWSISWIKIKFVTESIVKPTKSYSLTTLLSSLEFLQNVARKFTSGFTRRQRYSIGRHSIVTKEKNGIGVKRYFEIHLVTTWKRLEINELWSKIELVTYESCAMITYVLLATVTPTNTIAE